MHTASRTTACAADAQPSVLLAAVKQRAGQRAPNLATRLARELARQLPAKLHFLSSFQIEHAKHGPRQRSKVVHSSLSTTFMESKSGARTTKTMTKSPTRTDDLPKILSSANANRATTSPDKETDVDSNNLLYYSDNKLKPSENEFANLVQVM